jgi:trans-2,3-dihydro-3-hydroxyanthranilate isomerase
MAGGPLPTRFIFEEAAGLVTVDLMQEDGRIVGAELLSPQPLVRHTEVSSALAAACLGLTEADVRTDGHVPQVISVGLPFLVLELASREMLRRSLPNRGAYDALFPLDGARAVYAYVRDTGKEEANHGYDLHARMFTWRLVEDPATGSATAAVTALLAELQGTEVRLLVRQGEDMGRPSTLLTRSVFENEAVRAYVGGRCAAMFSGVFDLG